VNSYGATGKNERRVAICRFTVKIIKRSYGRSAVAALYAGSGSCERERYASSNVDERPLKIGKVAGIQHLDTCVMLSIERGLRYLGSRPSPRRRAS
jgi:hypothetical protein